MVPQPPEFLVQRLRAGKCILFVGSGLSAAAGLPTWSGLLQDITKWAERERPGAVNVQEIEDLLAKGKLTEVAEHLRDTIGLEGLQRAMAERLQVDNCPVPAVHQLITRLPFRAIITTNFDRLIERAFEHKIPVATQLDAEALADYIGKRDCFFLLKAHGDVERADTIVLTETDFGRMVYSNEAFKLSFLTLLMTHAILFVGYSVADLDFRLLLGHHSELFGSQGPPRYALIAGLGQVERSNLGRKTIQVLPYDKHEEVPEFFRLLLDALNRAPATETTKPPDSLGGIAAMLNPGRSAGASTGRRLNPAEVITQFERGTALEVEFLLLNDHPEIRHALRDHLGDQRYKQLRTQAKARVEQRHERSARGNVLLLPGLMASQLSVRDSSGRSSVVWINVLRLMTGGFRKLSLGNDGGGMPDVVASGLIPRHYDELLLRLSKRWNVLVFPYDWRRDLREVADELRQFLLSRLAEGTPCHIVAHGSGGLLARAFISYWRNQWEGLRDRDSADFAKGGRLVMLGTPNHGSFGTITLLTGMESLLRKIAFLDLRSDADDIRRVFASFPSIYQMLPSPHHHAAWESLYDANSYGGLEVSQDLLDRGLAIHEMIATAVEPERMVSILGHGQPTTVDVETPNDLRECKHWMVTYEGDGRTPHALARLELDGVPVPTYFVEEQHGTLMLNERVIGAIDEILRIGTAFGLSTDPNTPIRRVTPEENSKDEGGAAAST
jgi:hypothetical protein